MADRWILKELTVKGFRGFIEPKKFLISEPFTLFDGPQRSGKSSTLVAIEWGLFGDEIAKKAIGIDERRRWKIRNLNSDEARVEMVLQKGREILKIVRSDKNIGDSPNFYFKLNGIQSTDERKLRAVLGIQPKDYFSSVHLHQEIIRDLLTEEPRKRRDSLDRLLGLSELRDVLEGIKLAKILETLRDADNKLGQIEIKLNAFITSKLSYIKKAKERGIEKGLNTNEFSETGAKQMSEKLIAAIVNFANQAGLTIPDLALARTVVEQQIFVNSVKELLRKLRDEQPDLKRQNQLLEKQSQLQELQQEYKTLLDYLKIRQQKRKRIYETAGDQEKIDYQIKKELKHKLDDAKRRRTDIDKRAGIIEEAVKYFKTLKIPTKRQPCPVCKKPIDDVKHLQKHLIELRANLDKDLAPIRKRIEKYEEEIKILEDLKRSLKYLDEEISKKTKLLIQNKSIIETALGYKIKETEDPIVVLRNELEKMEKELHKVNIAVKESNQKLNAIEDNNFMLHQISTVLDLEAEIEKLLKIKESEEYKEVENRKLELEKFAADVDLINLAIDNVLQANARAKLNAAKNSINHVFKTLAGRSDFSEIEIDPNSFEIFAVKVSEKIPALSIFNQGDLNCAALSVFLGLATTQELSHNLGFIILDDPSQSLDSTHKENLISILNFIPDYKQILLSTSESDLTDLILTKIVRKKKRYKFGPWSDIEGAQPKES